MRLNYFILIFLSLGIVLVFGGIYLMMLANAGETHDYPLGYVVASKQQIASWMVLAGFLFFGLAVICKYLGWGWK